MIYLRFGIHLDDYSYGLDTSHGPRFTRWLPDGHADAVKIATADARNRLAIWFDRRGQVQDGFIRYDATQSGVDVNTMRRQGVLDAGPLLGESEFVHATKNEIEAARNDTKDAPDYVALGKRVVDFLAPPLAAFIDLLRTQYGQYWLPEFQPWDSRRESLGQYCRGLSLQWRETKEEEWRDLVPTKMVLSFTVSVPSQQTLGQFLTEADWREIQATFDARRKSPLALTIMARAHELLDSGHVSEAFIQAVSAVELAVGHYVSTMGGSDRVRPLVDQFLNLPLKGQVFILGATANALPSATIEASVEAIELRNKIVHEGQRLETHDARLFSALSDCVRVFARVSHFKMPNRNVGNSQSDPPPLGA